MAELNKGKVALIVGGIAAGGVLAAVLATTQPWSVSADRASSPSVQAAKPEAMQPSQSVAVEKQAETDRRAGGAGQPAGTASDTAVAASAPAKPEAPSEPVAAAATPPSFDIVRVEPNGETVIAGRGAPGATIELLRDGKSHARAVADTSGLFAFVPPPLPAGSQEIALQSVAPDGTKARSKETVTVVIASGHNSKPLVALASPDKPTVVLSSPEATAPGQQVAATTPAPDGQQPSVALSPQETPGAQTNGPSSTQKAEPAKEDGRTAARPPVRIASVESEEGGRLFVSGHAAPGATVRLYLNDTMIAPGGSDTEGKVAFAIGKGVRPGEYRVRLDDVDPVSGEVKTRAEVKYLVPEPVASITAPAPTLPGLAAPKTGGSQQVATLDPATGTGSALPANQAAPGRPPGSGETVPPGPSAGATAAPPVPTGIDGASAQKPTPKVDVAAARDISPSTIVVPEINTAIVSRGDNLWRISRRIYGRGIRYTVIYDANQDQIRSPGLIYPGQVFVLPSDGQPVAN